MNNSLGKVKCTMARDKRAQLEDEMERVAREETSVEPQGTGVFVGALLWVALGFLAYVIWTVGV